MNRRLFFRLIGGAVVLGQIPVWGCNNAEVNHSNSFKEQLLKEEDLFQQYLRGIEQSVQKLLDRQIASPAHDWTGGIPNAHGIATPMGTANFLLYLVTVYLSPDSVYHLDSKLLESMDAAARCLLRMQHPDGTIDLHATNFHSTPDTAFVVEPLALSATLLQRGASPKMETVLSSIRKFLISAGEALCTGGIHTPNHRWVVSMALARINALYPDERYRQRAQAWLAEGIDIDPDGQYQEKSTLIYSPLTNRCLITIARLLDLPQYYEPVRRNLEMTLYYLHPNGELVTEASGRQDRNQRGSAVNYYYPYYYMAQLDQDVRFAAMVRYIEEMTPLVRRQRQYAYFLESPGLRASLPDAGSLPTNYVRFFPYSGLLRIRRGPVDATIISDHPSFFTFYKENAVLQAVRLASAFFGKGQFESEDIEREGDTYHLIQHLDAPYYQPFSGGERPAGDLDWEEEREHRTKSEIQNLVSLVTITEWEGTFELQFDISGTGRVPLAIELSFRKGGQLSGVESLEASTDAFLLKEGFGKYTCEHQTIEFGPGHHAHNWTQLRGAQPKHDGLSVYLTGFTPFRYTLTIK